VRDFLFQWAVNVHEAASTSFFFRFLRTDRWFTSQGIAHAIISFFHSVSTAQTLPAEEI
jgi:hypothetical protein